MDNPTILLVAIMYVTIVSLSLGNVLMALAEIVRGRVQPDRVHLGWALLLPVVHVIAFWQTTEILEFEGWTLFRFMGFLVGPILLLFASSMLIDFPAADLANRAAHFESLRRRFFSLLALFSGWLVLLDLATGQVILQTFAAGALGALCVALILQPRERFQQLGMIAGWVLFLGSVTGG